MTKKTVKYTEEELKAMKGSTRWVKLIQEEAGLDRKRNKDKKGRG